MSTYFYIQYPDRTFLTNVETKANAPINLKMFTSEMGAYDYLRYAEEELRDGNVLPFGRRQDDDAVSDEEVRAINAQRNLIPSVQGAHKYSAIEFALRSFPDLKGNNEIQVLMNALAGDEATFQMSLRTTSTEVARRMTEEIAKQLTPPVIEKIVLLEYGPSKRVIHAIKEYRQLTGCGLKEAKEEVERIVGHVRVHY